LVPTTCPYCGAGCGLLLVLANNRVVDTQPWPGHPVSEGKLCIKGWNAHQFIHHPERLTKPLIRQDGGFRESSWEEALGLIAERLGGIKEKHGPDSVAFLSSAKCTNEENYLLQKLARAVIRTNNVDHCARLCHASTVVGLATAFGSGAMTNSISDLEESKCIFVIGSDTSSQHPLVARRIIRAKEKGAKLVVADPRRTHLAGFADLYLPLKPGTDVALMSAMAKVILEQGLEDKEFIEKRTEGFEGFKESLESVSLKEVGEITGVPAPDIEKAALMYARSEASAIVYAMGVTQHTTGTDNVLATANLAMLTGNVGKPGTGVNPLRGQNNVQGACDLGALPNVFPGYQSVAEAEKRQKFQQAWGLTELPASPGLTVVEMLDAASEGRVKAMYIMGENPMLSDPDLNHVEEALRSLEFLVVQDIFLTETARLADVVLPSASWAEKEGTFTNTERRVQLLRKAVEPPGEARPDWQIICELAKAMGAASLFAYSSAEEVFEEARRLTPQYAGMTYQRLDGRGLQWPCPTENHAGTPILHAEEFARGKGKFSPLKYKNPAEQPDEGYPLILTTGRVMSQWHTGTMTRRSPFLEEESPQAFIEISPEDAGQRGIKTNEEVEVTSRRGVIKVKAKVTSQIRPGVVFIPFHFFEGAANRLTIRALDPVAKIPEFKVCAVEVKPVGQGKINI